MVCLTSLSLLTLRYRFQCISFGTIYIRCTVQLIQ